MARGMLVHRGPFVAGPATRNGRRALWLVAGGLALLPVAALLAGVTDIAAFGVIGVVGVIAILAGGVLALVATVRDRERSLIVLATMPLALFWLVFAIGEIVDPH